MTHCWEPGTSYGYGDEVIYEGHKYKIIQPHRSQGDWSPPVTPALWGRINDDDCNPPQYHQQQHQQPPPHTSDDKYTQNQGGYQPPSQSSSENLEANKQEKKHWYDIDDDKKKALGIGGGLIAGAALLGAGVVAYKHHEHHKDEKEWLRDAETRAAQLQGNHASGAASWLLVHGKTIPPGAIQVGKEHNWTLYVARAFYKGALTVGKASDAFQKGAVIGYAHDEIHLDTYEILVGDMRGLKWVPATGKLNVASLNARPVEGGHESDGTPLFVARASHEGALHPGKASEKLKGAFIPYGGDEVEVFNYEILCYY